MNNLLGVVVVTVVAGLLTEYAKRKVFGAGGVAGGS